LRLNSWGEFVREVARKNNSGSINKLDRIPRVRFDPMYDAAVRCKRLSLMYRYCGLASQLLKEAVPGVTKSSIMFNPLLRHHSRV
jgi:hypothetical protein